MSPRLPVPERIPTWLARARERLDEAFVSPPPLADLAAEAGVTPRHLARAFRRHYGETIGSFVHRRRIRSAMDALLNSSEQVAHIALRTGYFDQSHFARHFKRELGIAPGAYRRRSRDGTETGAPAVRAVAPGRRRAPAAPAEHARALLLVTAAALAFARRRNAFQ